MLRDWLAAHVEIRSTLAPASLLGVYAAHLTRVEACRMLANQVIKFTWPESVHDLHACLIGHYLDRFGEHDTVYGLAHEHFRSVITTRESAPVAWEVAAEVFLTTLTAAILRGSILPARQRVGVREKGPAWQVEAGCHAVCRPHFPGRLSEARADASVVPAVGDCSRLQASRRPRFRSGVPKAAYGRVRARALGGRA